MPVDRARRPRDRFVEKAIDKVLPALAHVSTVG